MGTPCSRRTAGAAVLGAGTDLRAVTAAKAEWSSCTTQWEGLAGTTIHRRLKHAHALFAHALRLTLVAENPFADAKGKAQNTAARRHYVTVEDTRKLIDAANPTWRTIISLCRLAALRCPSTVPIFAVLRPHLDEAFDLAEPGDVYVIGGKTGAGYRAAADIGDGWKSAHVRPTFEKIVRRAGLTQ